MHDERRERNTATGTGSAGSSYGGYGASGSYPYRSYATYGGAYPSSSNARGENPDRPYAPYTYPPSGSYGPGNTQGTGWETVPMPATAITRSWHQPFSAQSGPGAEKLPSPVARPLGAAAQPAAASARQRQKKGFSMPKEQARRLAQRLKRWAVALAVAGFGTFSALVAFHQASATASSSSSSGAQSQVSTPASSNSSSSSSSSSTNATSNGSGASSSSSGSSSSSASSSSTGSSSSQDSNGFFNQQGGDNFGSQPTFGQGHSGSGVS